MCRLWLNDIIFRLKLKHNAFDMIWKFCCLEVALCLLQLPSTLTSESLTPENVTDGFDNHGDMHSVITWGPLPEPKNPYLSTPMGNSRVPESFHNMVNGFTYTVQPHDPPYDILLKLVRGDTAAITDNIYDLVLFAAGIAVCVVLGLLFIMCMPLVGCCFCCCRLCGKCGGKMKTTKNPHANAYCCCLTVSLLIISLTMTVGIVFVYFINYDVSDIFENLEPKMTNTMTNLKFFLKNTADEMNYVAADRFAFVEKLMNRDLDIGKPIREELDTATGISILIGKIYSLDTTMDKLVVSMGSINTDTPTLKTLDASLNTQLASARSDVATTKAHPGCVSSACTSIHETKLDIDADFSLLPDLTSKLTSLTNLAAKDMSKSAKDGKKGFDDIPEKVTNATAPQVQDIQSQLKNFKITISDSMAQVTDLPKKVENPLDGMIFALRGFSGYLKTFDTYRSYSALGVVSMLAIVVLMQFTGAILACCCYNGDKLPRQRSKASDCGGNCLMAAAGLSFIFSSILMLLVTVPFVVGALLDRDVCDPLTDTEYKMMKKFLDIPDGVNGKGYFMSAALLGNSSIPLKFSDVLEGCKKNYPSYYLLKLEALMDVDEITDYKKNIDIESQTNAMTADFSDIGILSTDTKGQLLDLKLHSQIPISTFKLQLMKSTTKTDLTSYASQLRVIAADVTNSGAKPSLLSNADKIDMIQATYNNPTQQAQSSLLKQIDAYDALSSGIPNEVDGVITDAGSAESKVHLEAPKLMKKYVSTFTKRILSTTDEFAKETSNAVRGQVGRCKPVWLVWESLLQQFICKESVGSLNAFWFALGWCIFFMIPSIILSVKLAKYLRNSDIKGGNNTEGKGAVLLSVRAIMSGDPKKRNQIRPAMKIGCQTCGGEKCAECGRMEAPPAYGQLPPLY